MISYLSKTSAARLRGIALLRLDFNTEDEWRMEATLSTIRFVLRRAEKVVIMSHRGRPEGVDKKLSLAKDARNLQKLLKRKVVFLPHFHFSEIKTTIEVAPKGSVFLLENLRFLSGEEKNETTLAKQLASLADYYINDAFAVSHRSNASVDAITRYLPSYGGLELESELKHLSHVMGHPKRPLMIIFGGGKAHDKLPVIHFFRKKADAFILGGAVANTILEERGLNIENSTVDEDPGPQAEIIARYKNAFTPVDFRVHRGRILDVGPKTERFFASKVAQARTIIWNGPLGFIEKKKFAHGTFALAKAIGENKKAFRLAGGGETVMFIKENKLDKNFNFVSTGGGAMLEYLSGKKLPGIEALSRIWQKKK